MKYKLKRTRVHICVKSPEEIVQKGVKEWPLSVMGDIIPIL